MPPLTEQEVLAILGEKVLAPGEPGQEAQAGRFQELFAVDNRRVARQTAAELGSGDAVPKSGTVYHAFQECAIRVIVNI